MHDIYMEEPTQDYIDVWAAAGSHLYGISQGAINWIKSDPRPPFLEHLSFWLGNQIFFLRIEDVDDVIRVPGNPDGLLMIAEGFEARACILPMKKNGTEWRSALPDWGLIDARTRKPLNPVDLISDEKIEMTPWELQDFAVQIVRDYLVDQGFEIMSFNSAPAAHPSIWFVRDQRPEWVEVVYALYPAMEIEHPPILDKLLAAPRLAACPSSIAKVFIASSAQITNESDVFIPPYRGHELSVRFEGLDPLNGINS